MMSDTPDIKLPEYAAAAPIWKQSRDALEGTRTIRAAGEDYLARFAGEGDDVFALRLSGAVFFNGFARTIRAMTGLATQRPPKKVDVPAMVVKHMERIDRRGRSLNAFLSSSLDELLAMGCGGIFVDSPAVPIGQRPVSLAEEQRRGLRPYWMWIAPEDVTWIDWRLVGSAMVVSHFVRRAVESKPDGRFGVVEAEVYWEYVAPLTGPVQWFKWEWVEKEAKKSAKKGPKKESVPELELKITSEGTLSPRLKGIPFASCPVGKGKHDFYRVSPLLDLLDINLRHYQTDAALHWNLLMQAYGVSVRLGAVPDLNGDLPPVPMGPSVMVDIQNPQGDFKIVGPPSEAFEPQMRSMQMDVTNMATIGLAFMQPTTRAAETAEARRLDMQAGQATLRDVLELFKDCAEAATAFHAQIIGKADKDGEGGSLEFAFDFDDSLLSADLLNALSNMQVKGQLTLPTLLKAVALGKLPEDFDPEEEAIAVQLQGIPMPGDEPIIPKKPDPAPKDPAAVPPAEPDAPGTGA
jgi:hypothetical protein